MAVYKDKHASYSKLLERAKLSTLASRRLQDICIVMYKVKHRLCPSSICNIFNDQSSAYNLRQSLQIFLLLDITLLLMGGTLCVSWDPNYGEN